MFEETSFSLMPISSLKSLLLEPVRTLIRRRVPFSKNVYVEKGFQKEGLDERTCQSKRNLRKSGTKARRA